MSSPPLMFADGLLESRCDGAGLGVRAAPSAGLGRTLVVNDAPVRPPRSVRSGLGGAVAELPLPGTSGLPLAFPAGSGGSSTSTTGAPSDAKRLGGSDPGRPGDDRVHPLPDRRPRWLH